MCDRDPAVGIATTTDEKQEQMPNESSRKHAAVSFLKLAASGRVDEAYANHVSPTFRNHNPYFAGDAESLKKGMAGAAAKFPDTTLEVQHVLEEGDLIAVHSRVRHSADTPEIAVVHIVRFEERRIAKMWDVGMEAPKESPNENGMFLSDFRRRFLDFVIFSCDFVDRVFASGGRSTNHTKGHETALGKAISEHYTSSRQFGSSGSASLPCATPKPGHR